VRRSSDGTFIDFLELEKTSSLENMDVDLFGKSKLCFKAILSLKW
jgi:hypothetical protein